MQSQKKQNYVFPHQEITWNQKKQLLQQVSKANNLEQALKKLNTIHQQKTYWQPKSLKYKEFKEEEVFDLIKYIAIKALMVQKLFPNGIKISKPLPPLESNKSWIILSKMQCCCLVACMFLSVLNKQNTKQTLPRFFTFRYLSQKPNQITKTVLIYFRKIRSYQKDNSKMLYSNNIVYLRLSEFKTVQQWIKSQFPLSEVRYHTTGAIQDLETQIQIDFANQSIGGFFLMNTYTQEDIIFINNPELMPALLFHSYMEDHQSILLIGSQTIATYTGYLDTYQMASQKYDERKLFTLKIDQNTKIQNVRNNWISAIDAIPQFSGNQFEQKNMLRQLNKAYCGFHIKNLDNSTKNISTGNWGSGAFNGNLQYKFLIQWIAASVAGRSFDYYSFNDQRSTKIPDIIKQCRHLNAGQLCKIILQLSNQFKITKKIFSTLTNSIKKNKIN